MFLFSLTSIRVCIVVQRRGIVIVVVVVVFCDMGQSCRMICLQNDSEVVAHNSH